MTPVLMQLDSVRFRYDAEPVLDGASLELREGERLGLIGAMGSGKTTVLLLLVGLLKPEAGSVYVFGRPRRTESDFGEVRGKAGLVFQDSDDQLFCPTVLEDVAFGPLNLGRSARDAAHIASDALAQVGLEGFEERVTYRLSGGEKRLVALATVLAMQPDVLLLDEPQNGLDQSSCERIQRLLTTLPQSMIVVSHDHAFLETVTTRRAHLRDGRIA